MEKEYLERIISLLEEQLKQKDEYIKLLLKEKKSDSVNQIEHELFTTINDNLQEINIDNYLDAEYPAKTNLSLLLSHLCFGENKTFNTLIPSNKNTIQYINNETLHSVSINELSPLICNHVFNSLKTKYLSQLNECRKKPIRDDQEEQLNNIIQNLSLLKDNSTITMCIKKMLSV